MERICPYLALADDGRTVADGFDAEHRCHALTPPGPLERARQVQLCLTETHDRCERFASARTARLAASSGLPRVAPDVAFGRTRLILDPEPVRRTRTASPAMRVSRRTVLVAVLGAAAVALVVFGNLFGVFGGPPLGDSATPSASVSSAASPTSPPASVGPGGSPSVAPTGNASAPESPTPAASQRTYVVKAGDTLNQIAQQFGTTAEAIQAVNGLTGPVINIGQVLVIP